MDTDHPYILDKKLPKKWEFFEIADTYTISRNESSATEKVLKEK